MRKIKENILFIIVSFTIMIFFSKVAFHFFTEYEKTWIDVIKLSGIVTCVLSIAKIFGFLDKKKKSTD